MVMYKREGSTLEAGVPAQTLVIAYKANRDSPSTMGEELGRTVSETNGTYRVTWDDWPEHVFLVAIDLTSAVKYEAKIVDWALGNLDGYDPYRAFVVFNSNLNGADDATAFVDDVGHTMVARGNAVTSTDQAKYGGSSAYFSGTDGDGISVSYDSGFDWGEKDFCVEGWVYLISSTAVATIFSHRAGSGVFGPWLIQVDSGTLKVYVRDGNVSGWVSDTSAGTIPTGEWHHVAFSRQGDTFRAFIDGVITGGLTYSSAIEPYTGPLMIGGELNDSRPLHGYVDDSRVTVGTPRYTAPFYPPVELSYEETDPYFGYVVSLIKPAGPNNGTNIPDLIGNNTQRRDDAKMVDYEYKFDGFSIRFDGNEDRLDITYDSSMHFGSNDFTVEAWAYHYGIGSNPIILSNRISGGLVGNFRLMVHNTGVLRAYIRFSGNVTRDFYSTDTVELNTWNHLAITRKGNVFRLFINGKWVASMVDSRSVITSTQNWYLGRSGDSGDMNGHIGTFRATIGAARYVTHFPVSHFPFPES